MVRGAAFLRLFLDDVLGMPINSEEELGLLGVRYK